MASSNHPANDQARNSKSLSSEIRHGRSKSQMFLSKILHIISTFPPPEITNNEQCLSPQHKNLVHFDENRALLCENRGFDVDLNITICPPAELDQFLPQAAAAEVRVSDEKRIVAESYSPEVSAEFAILEKSLESVDDRNEVHSVCVNEESNVVEEREIQKSEISNVGDQSSGINNNGGSEEETTNTEPKQGKLGGGEGCLGLLIDAAQLILGELESEPAKPSRETEPSYESTKSGTKSKSCWRTTAAPGEERWYGESVDTSPVVKSKRGRSQVLPFKYRDTILEPLARLSRPRSTAVSSKRK